MPPKKKKAAKKKKDAGADSKSAKKATGAKKAKSTSPAPKEKKDPAKGAEKKAPAKSAKKAKKGDASAKKGAKKGKAKKGKENIAASDSEEELPHIPTERELWRTFGKLPEDTCGAEDLLRYELLAHDEAMLQEDIERRPHTSSANGFAIHWLPEVSQKWHATPPVLNTLLKSDKLPRLGKAHEPDRKGVERCWLLLRSHFTPIKPPPKYDEAVEARKKEESDAVRAIHKFFRRFSGVKVALDAFLRPPDPTSPTKSVGQGPSTAFVLPLNDAHALLAPRAASLRGFYDFLESAGEAFQGGYPYDPAKWRPLQYLIREHYFLPDDYTRMQVRPRSSSAAFALDGIDRRVAAKHLPLQRPRILKPRRRKDDLRDRPLSPREAVDVAHDVAQGNLEVAEFIDEDACNAPDPHGDRPLVVAVLAGKLRSINALLERGAWPSAPSCSPYASGATALHYACAKADADAVQILLKGGADPNACTTAGEVPLHYLCRAPLPPPADEVESDSDEDAEPPDANLTNIAKLLIDFGAHPDGYEDRRLNRADLLPPPIPEEADAKGKKKGKKKAPAKKKGKKDKGDDDGDELPPPEQGGPVTHEGHRATSETHAAQYTPLQHAASVGHHAILKELLRREARAASVAETDAGDRSTAVSLCGRAIACPDPPTEAFAALCTLRTYLHLPPPLPPGKGGPKKGAKKKKAPKKK